MDIRIDDELRDLIPPLTQEEYAQLEDNIVADGCRDPLVIWDGTLVDGHNRYRICTEHGLEFATVDMLFESRLHAKVWMRENQRGRRNLTPAWRIELALKNKEDLAEIGRVRMSAAGEGYRPSAQKEGLLFNNKPSNEPAHNTQADIAKEAGVSPGYVGKAEVIQKQDPALWEQAKRGSVSIERAYSLVKETQMREELEAAAQDDDCAAAVLELVREGETSIKQAYKDAISTPAKRDKLQKQIAQNMANDIGELVPTVAHASAQDWILSQEPYDLLLTDPPYSTDVPDIESFVESWLPDALAKLKSTGRAYIFIGAYPAEMAAYMNCIMPAQVLVWTYRNTLGPQPKHDYIRNWQAILYYRMPDAPPLDCPLIMEQISVHDHNHPARSMERLHSWQKPLELAEKFVRHATKPGDVVVDPFACTGTHLLAAARVGRIAKGCEIDADNLAIAIERGCGHE